MDPIVLNDLACNTCYETQPEDSLSKMEVEASEIIENAVKSSSDSSLENKKIYVIAQDSSTTDSRELQNLSPLDLVAVGEEDDDDLAYLSHEYDSDDEDVFHDLSETADEQNFLTADDDGDVFHDFPEDEQNSLAKEGEEGQATQLQANLGYAAGKVQEVASNLYDVFAGVLGVGANLAGNAACATVGIGVSCVAGAGRGLKNGAIGSGIGLASWQIRKLTESLKSDSLEAILKDDGCQQKLALIDPEGQLRPVSEKLAEKILPIIEGFLAEKLKDSSLYAGNESCIKEMLQTYLPQLMMRVIYRFAICNAEPLNHDSPHQCLLLNATKTLLKLLHTHFKVNQYAELQSKIRMMDAQQDESYKQAILKELQETLTPFSAVLLTTIGIDSQNDLRLNKTLGSSFALATASFFNIIGDLPSEFLPNLLISALRELKYASLLTAEAKAEVATFSGSAEFPEFISAVLQKLMPQVKTVLSSNKTSLATSAGANLALSPASIEPIISYLAEGEGPELQNFWLGVKENILPYMLDILKGLSLEIPLDTNADTLPQNILERILLNAVKLVYSTLHGKEAALCAKVTAFDRLATLMHVLKAGKAYLIQNPASLSFADISPEEQIAQYDQVVEAILEQSQLTVSQGASLIEALRQFYEYSHVGSEQELLRKFLFNAEQPTGSFDMVEDIAYIDRNINKVQDRQSDVLGGTFGGLEHALLGLIGLGSEEAWERAKFSKLCSYQIAKQQLLPELLLNLYRDLYNQPKNLMVELKVLLYHNPNHPQGREVLRDILTRGNINAYDQLFLEEASVEPMAQLVDGTLRVVAEDIKDHVKIFLASEANIVSILKPVLEGVPGLNEANTAPFLQDIACALGREEPFMQAVYSYLQKNIENVLLKVLLHIGQAVDATAPAADLNSRPLLGKALLEIFKLLNHHKDEIAIAMHHAPAAGSEEYREIFRPLALNLMTFTGLSMADFPLPEALKDVVWAKLVKDLLPDYMGKIYTSITCLETSEVKEANERTLRRIYGTSHPSEAMRALSGYAAESVQSYLAVNSSESAALLYSQLEVYLSQGSMQAQVAGQRELIVDLLKDNITFAVGPSATIQSMLTSSKEYIHSVLSTAFTNLSENVKSVDDFGGADFLKETGFAIMRIFRLHVEKINTVRLRRNQANAFDIDSLEMLREFQALPSPEVSGEQLVNLTRLPEYLAAKTRLKEAEEHLANLKSIWGLFATNREINEAQQELETAKTAFSQLRKDHYFKPLAKKLLKLAKLNSSSFKALPEEIKEQVWRVFEDTALPSMLDNLCSELMKPQTLNSIMLALINSTQHTLEGLGSQEVVAEEPNVVNGENENEQNRLCGSTVSQLLDLFPETMSKSIFDIDVVRHSSEQAIGRAVRDSFGDKTLIERVDAMLCAALPTLIPDSEWRLENGDTVGNERFTRRTSIPLEQGHLQPAASTPSDLKQMMVQTLSRKIRELISSTVLAPWQNFCKSRRAEHAQWGAPAAVLADKVLDILEAMRMFLAKWIAIPIFEAGWFLVEHFYLAKRADEIIANFNMADVHEQFLFDTINYSIEAFEQKLSAANAQS